MNTTQTTVIDAVETLQAERDDLRALLAAVAAADTGQLDGPHVHVIHLPGEVLAGIRARLS